MSFGTIIPPSGGDGGSESTAIASVITYGADPTGTTDSLAAFNSALAAGTTIIFVPPGTYKMTDTWVINRPVHIMGPTSRAGVTGATLVFNAGRDGIRVAYSGGLNAIIEDLCVTTNVGTGAWAANTTNYTPGSSTVIPTAYAGYVFIATTGTHSGPTEPTWPTTEGATVVETGTGSPVTWTAHAVAGVKIQASCTIREVLATGFPGDGFSVFASTGDVPATNANQFKLDHCIATLNTGRGFYTQGADANAGLLEGCTAFTNGIAAATISVGGFVETSFLGNTYVGCTAEANIQYAYYVPASAASNSSSFYGCYCESGQLININAKASWHGDARGALPYGNGQIISPYRINTLYVLNDTSDNGTGTQGYTKVGNPTDVQFMEYAYGPDAFKRMILQPNLVSGAGHTGVTAWNYNGGYSPYGFTLDTEATYGGAHFWIPRDFLIGAPATENVIGTAHSFPGKSNFSHSGGNIGTYPSYPYGMFFKEYVPYLNGGFLGYLNLQTGNPGTWAPVAKARYSRATAISITLETWDWYIGVTDTSAIRTITLPTLGSEDMDTIEFVIKDESGAAGTPNPIKILPPGAELLDGVNTFKTISVPYGTMTVIRRNGAWFTDKPSAPSPDTIANYTASHTVLAGEHGSVFTNAGASGDIEYTLPTAAAGLRYAFAVHAAHYLRVTASAGDLVRVAEVDSAVAGYIRSTDVGGFLEIIAVDSTVWLAKFIPTRTWLVDE